MDLDQRHKKLASISSCQQCYIQETGYNNQSFELINNICTWYCCLMRFSTILIASTFFATVLWMHFVIADLCSTKCLAAVMRCEFGIFWLWWSQWKWLKQPKRLLIDAYQVSLWSNPLQQSAKTVVCFLPAIVLHLIMVSLFCFIFVSHVVFYAGFYGTFQFFPMENFETNVKNRCRNCTTCSHYTLTRTFLRLL